MWLACGGIVLIVRVIGYWSSKATKSKAKQRKTKESKAWRKFFQNVIKIVENCNKIKVQRGSGEVLGALFAPNFAVSGVLGGTWEHLAPKTWKKGEKHDLFGCFWTVLGGVLAPMWAPRGHLGCILGVLGSILGAFGWILGAFFGHFVAYAAFQKTLKNLRFS